MLSNNSTYTEIPLIASSFWMSKVFLDCRSEEVDDVVEAVDSDAVDWKYYLIWFTWFNC